MSPSDHDRLPREFTDLVDKRLAGIITPEEQLRLEHHLEATPGATAYYLALAATEALLPDALSLGRLRSEPPANILRPPVFVRRRRQAAFGFAAAAAVMAVAGVSVFMMRDSGPAARVASGVPATVSHAVGVRWTRGATVPGERLAADSGEISAGFVELTFDSGVRLLVEGPAAYSITGPNSCRLAYGKAVADVPPGARGFVLDGPGERIIDHGTRFAVDVARGGGATTVGVLSGEIEVRHGDRDVRLYTDYALRRTGDTLDSVPFEKGGFVTEVPSREFDWNLDGVAHDTPVELRFDVSRLVHGAGDYRAVFKWLLGDDALIIRSVRLERDGRVVARRDSPGSTGLMHNTSGNSPLLSVAPADGVSGKWELVASVFCEGRFFAPGTPVSSRGIVTLEEGLATTATAGDFVGRWRYSHRGDEYVREFGADGFCRMSINGKSYAGATGVPYEVKDGVLSMLPTGMKAPERMMLRDDGTLVFLNQPYRNARRITNAVK